MVLPAKQPTHAATNTGSAFLMSHFLTVSSKKTTVSNMIKNAVNIAISENAMDLPVLAMIFFRFILIPHCAVFRIACLHVQAYRLYPLTL